MHTKKKSTHAYAYTQTSDSLKVLAKQTNCKLSDSYRPKTTTLQLLVINLLPQLQVQSFIYKYQRSELWYLSSDAVQAQETTSKLLPSPVSSEIPISKAFVFMCLHTNASQFWFSWLRSSSEAVQCFWATRFWTEASSEALLPICSSVSSAPLATSVVSTHHS